MDEEFRNLLRKEAAEMITESEKAHLQRLRQLLPGDLDWAYEQLLKKTQGRDAEDYGYYEYADNFRIARTYDEEALSHYEEVRERGCCGSLDWTVVDPQGVEWVLGFNYGH